ncbi:ABC-type sugar transport system, ATPase component [Sphaerochaeta pleomorpha str. Grapes]|uniref:ABC-type sugar transport system, ATPase component n=1 Tax=Sphaerochaeta pleomorpha (strain ATCC BAA-1885 / DSM 22778 / Grapes) TaxID=158190 RepID=G8QVK6_SPHPG|nr:ATP-binding cassette domain-containing protein [Sphaerochaeta pleomorpha]AEV28239.1 ABC-type sugar transport system, ATPase component [Sphaerochaeta pleomorpha str. Grapes]
MKEEILRLEQVSLPPYLFDINLHLNKGEIVALIGINALGIEQLLTIMCQNIPIHYGHVYCQDKLVNDYLSSSKKKNRVVVIQKESMLIDSMTVEENLFVVRNNFQKHLVNYRVLYGQLQILLRPFGIELAQKTLAKDLSSYERLVVQFVKASICKANLIILKDITNFVSEVDLNRLYGVLQFFKDQGMTFLYVCNHHQEAFRFCSRCYLMQEGRIVKHLFPYQMNDEVISHYSNVFEERVESEQRQKQYDSSRLTDSSALVCKNLVYGNIAGLELTIHQGETVVLLDNENLIIDDLFTLLKGMDVSKNGVLLVNGHLPAKNDREVALIDVKPDKTLLFPQLSVLDNICFTADHKIKHLWLDHVKKKSIAKELYPVLGKSIYKPSLYGLERDALYRIVYQRIILQKPSFVCVVQPFASVDMYQRIQLISYFDMFRQKGIAVLVLAVSLSDTLQIADRLIVVKGGRAESQSLRREFSQYIGIAGSVPAKPKE